MKNIKDLAQAKKEIEKEIYFLLDQIKEIKNSTPEKRYEGVLKAEEFVVFKQNLLKMQLNENLLFEENKIYEILFSIEKLFTIDLSFWQTDKRKEGVNAVFSKVLARKYGEINCDFPTIALNEKFELLIDGKIVTDRVITNAAYWGW